MNHSKQKFYFHPLFCTHQIFLSREQRYDLYHGITVEAVGSLIQTSVVDKHKNLTKEVFLKYKIDMDIAEDKVEVLKNSYNIHVPTKKYEEDEEVKEGFKENINSTFVWENDILDYTEGGHELLYFKYRKIYTIESKKILVMHSVEIKDIKILEKSIYFFNLN